MKVIGSKACKIEKDLPKTDMDHNFSCHERRRRGRGKDRPSESLGDGAWLSRSTQASSLACKVVAQQIEASKVIYETLATSARGSN